MGLFGDQDQRQEIEGNHNQQAGRDIHNHYPPQISHTPSAIEKVLSGIFNILENQAPSFKPLDTQPYTISSKIDYNEIVQYKDNLNDFTEGYALVEAQIKTIAPTEPAFEIRLIWYIKSVFRDASRSDSQTAKTADEIIFGIRQRVEQDLVNCHSKINLEEKRAVEFVIFYLFAQCKIFKKPPVPQP